MKLPSIAVVYDRRKAAESKGVGSVEVRLTHDRKQKYFNTGVAVAPSQWKDGSVVGHPDAPYLNARIEGVLRPIKDFISALMIQGIEFSFAALDKHLDKESMQTDFVAFVEERIRERPDIRETTRRTNLKLVGALEEFGKMSTFADVTREAVMEFDEWLHARGYKQSTVHSYHKFLKVQINYALRKGMLKVDPYVGVRIETGKSSQRKYLTSEEMTAIRECVPLTDSLKRVRDLFLFQYYTGLAYADLRAFDFSKAVERGGRWVVHDQRVKSEEDFYIVIIPQAVEILRRYDFVLPLMTNEQYNMRLKAVADCAGIRKTVTSHMARHSFAVNALNNGIPIEIVAKMMGHTNTNTTQIYAKIVNKSVESAFDVIADSV